MGEVLVQFWHSPWVLEFTNMQIYNGSNYDWSKLTQPSSLKAQTSLVILREVEALSQTLNKKVPDSCFVLTLRRQVLATNTQSCFLSSGPIEMSHLNRIWKTGLLVLLHRRQGRKVPSCWWWDDKKLNSQVLWVLAVPLLPIAPEGVLSLLEDNLKLCSDFFFFSPRGSSGDLLKISQEKPKAKYLNFWFKMLFRSLRRKYKG